MAAFFDADDVASDLTSESEFEGTDSEKRRYEEQRIEKQDAIDGKIMCCCKPNLIHDETLKFQLLYSEKLKINDTQITGEIRISKEKAEQIKNTIV